MARQPGFSSPLLLGFEEIERLLDRVNKTAHEGYPPYNIEQFGRDRIRITLAVAGFGRDTLAVTVEDNQLVIRGNRREDAEDPERTVLYRGIATRQFQRSFVLAEGIEVEGADLENGLLAIDLRRPRPETFVRTIEIKTAGDGESQTSGPSSVLKLSTRRGSE